MPAKKLVIMGFGGHARSVADVALACGYTQLLFVEPSARAHENFLGHPVIAQWNGSHGAGWDAFAASGDGRQRLQQCQEIARHGLPLVSLLSPLASLGAGSLMEAGCFVGHHAHIGPLARVGKACIVNTGAVVEHEASVGDYSHVAVNACIAGRSHIGAFCMLGAAATLINALSVTDGVRIGAGAVVCAAITMPGTYVGVPARRLA